MQSPSLSSITRRFGVGDCLEVLPIEKGKVNRTFRVKTPQGVFILQRLKPPFNEDTVLDGQALTSHLARKGFKVPRFQLTPEGLPYVKEGSQIYRLMTYLEGRTLKAMDDPRLAFAAGELVGRFHAAIRDFQYVPRFRMPGLHDAEYVLSRLKELTLQYPGKAREVGDILLRLELEIPLLLLPPHLPRRLIHGDLKYTNLLFDGQGKALALLDFDTLMISTIPVEMGDAFRSWCTRKHASRGPMFDVELFRQGWKGYLSSHPPISAEERKWIVQGIKLLLLELSARYLVDYFEDYYFAWDARRFPDRASHNLFRSRRQLVVFEDLLRKENRLHKIIEEGA